jgi:peroxiredoxin
MRRLSALLFTFAVVLLAGSIAIIVIQGRRIFALEVALAGSQLRSDMDGAVVPTALHVKDLGGSDHVLDVAAGHRKPTMLYVFRPSCPVCWRNGESVNSLAAQLGEKYEVVGLSLDREGLESFLQREGPKFPIYTDVSQDIVKAYRLGSTPQTILVSPDGRIIHSWIGGYAGPVQLLIERFFSVNLPGIPAA